MNGNSILPHTVLVLAIVTGGVALLNYLPKDAIFPDKPIQQAPVATKNSAKKDQGNGFDFYDILKAGEVVVSESNYVSTPKTAKLDKPTLLQIAATKSKSAADSIAARLSEAGLKNVKVIEKSSGSGNLFLVRTTPFKTYSEVKAASTIVEKLNHHPLVVTVK
jgi:cell division septation protein DedD